MNKQKKLKNKSIRKVKWKKKRMKAKIWPTSPIKIFHLLTKEMQKKSNESISTRLSPNNLDVLFVFFNWLLYFLYFHSPASILNYFYIFFIKLYKYFPMENNDAKCKIKKKNWKIWRMKSIIFIKVIPSLLLFSTKKTLSRCIDDKIRRNRLP